MDQLLILFIFTLVPLLCAYVCLFKTKWIADTLRVPDGGVPYLSGAGVFYAGLMLLGAGLIILSVGPIIDGIINLVERWLAGGVPALSHPHFWLVTLNPAWQAGIHLGLAFYIIKYPFKIMEWVNVESAPASDSAQDGMAS